MSELSRRLRVVDHDLRADLSAVVTCSHLASLASDAEIAALGDDMRAVTHRMERTLDSLRETIASIESPTSGRPA